MSDGDHEWEAEVVDRSPPDTSFNLLYHSLQWHGTYRTQASAPSIVAHEFPDERWLWVRDRAYEVMIRLSNIETRGVGQDAHFVRGTIEVKLFKRPCTRGFSVAPDSHG